MRRVLIIVAIALLVFQCESPVTNNDDPEPESLPFDIVVENTTDFQFELWVKSRVWPKGPVGETIPATVEASGHPEFLYIHRYSNLDRGLYYDVDFRAGNSDGKICVGLITIPDQVYFLYEEDSTWCEGAMPDSHDCRIQIVDYAGWCPDCIPDWARHINCNYYCLANWSKYD